MKSLIVSIVNAGSLGFLSFNIPPSARKLSSSGIGSIIIRLPSALIFARPCLVSPASLRIATGMCTWYLGVMVVYFMVIVIVVYCNYSVNEFILSLKTPFEFASASAEATDGQAWQSESYPQEKNERA